MRWPHRTIASPADRFGSTLCANSCFQSDSYDGFSSQSCRSCMIYIGILIALPSCIVSMACYLATLNFNDLSGRQPPLLAWLGCMLMVSLPYLWTTEQLFIIDFCIARWPVDFYAKHHPALQELPPLYASPDPSHKARQFAIQLGWPAPLSSLLLFVWRLFSGSLNNIITATFL